MSFSLHFNHLEIGFLIAFALCLIAGLIGTLIYKKIRRTVDEKDILEDMKIIKQEKLSSEDLSKTLDNMAEEMFSDKSRKDRDDDYIEY